MIAAFVLVDCALHLPLFVDKKYKRAGEKNLFVKIIVYAFI